MVQLVGTGFGMVSGFASAWIAGERNPTNLFKATAIGGVVGLVSTIPGGLATTVAIGASTNAVGDLALKAWTGQSEQISTSSVASSTGLGAVGGVFGSVLGRMIVPNRNLPATPGTYTNYIQQTIRQLAHNDSEVLDATRRSIQANVHSGIFGVTTRTGNSYFSGHSYSFNFGASSFSGFNSGFGGICYAPGHGG